MLTKDQMFAIYDFVNTNSGERLWMRSEKLLDLTQELSHTDPQRIIINKFISKNSNRIISELETSIFSLFKKLIEAKDEQEVAFDLVPHMEH
jgi:hypothetical protein